MLNLGGKKVHKLHRLCLPSNSLYRNPLEEAVDAFGIEPELYLSPLKLHPCLLHRIEMECIPAIPIALDWPRWMWYSNVVQHLADALLALPNPLGFSVPRIVLPYYLTLALRA